MNRGPGPKADPSKVKAWQQRSQAKGGLTRTKGLARLAGAASLAKVGMTATQALEVVQTKPKRPRKGKTKVRVPAGVRATVYARSRGVCFACLADAGVDPFACSLAWLERLGRDGILARAVQVHHVLPERDYPDLAKDPLNLVGVCVACHMAHEFPGVNDGRFPWAWIPLEVREHLDDYARRHPLAGGFLARTYR